MVECKIKRDSALRLEVNIHNLNIYFLKSIVISTSIYRPLTGTRNINTFKYQYLIDISIYLLCDSSF